MSEVIVVPNIRNSGTANVTLASNGNVTEAGQLSAGSYSGLPASGVLLRKHILKFLEQLLLKQFFLMMILH